MRQAYQLRKPFATCPVGATTPFEHHAMWLPAEFSSSGGGISAQDAGVSDAVVEEENKERRAQG